MGLAIGKVVVGHGVGKGVPTVHPSALVLGHGDADVMVVVFNRSHDKGKRVRNNN